MHNQTSFNALRQFIPLYETQGVSAFTVSGDQGVGGMPVDVVVPVQTHSLNVAVVRAGDTGPDDTDALVTFDTSLLIGVRTADCVPVLLWAPDIHAVAAIHAGWRGSLHGIVDRTVERLAVHGADPSAMTAIFGPSICRQCYEVAPELAADFDRMGFAHCLHPAPAHDPLTHRVPDPLRPHLDLEAVNRTRLIAVGLQPSHIIASPMCTRHSRDAYGQYLPSWRREATADRLITCIALTADD